MIEYRYANRKRDRLPQLEAELVGLKVAVIVTTGGPPTRAAKRATKTIPIVMTIVGRPVPRYVESLSRPGGNITGLTARSSDFAGKRMELLKEAFPQVSKVALLRDPSFTSHSFRETEAAAHAMGLQTQSVEFRGANDLESALAAITKGGANALIVLPFPGLKSLRGQIIELAAKSHRPAMYQWKNFVRAGGFMAYGPNLTDNFRRAAYYVDRLLKGTKPGDLPVEQPRRFDLSINLKTAKQLGITIPPEVLFKATEVIK